MADAALPGPVVFLGSNDVAARCLEALVERAHVALVVTPPSRRRGRGKKPTPTVVGATAADLDIDVVETADVNRPEVVERIRAVGAELLVVVSFGQILRKAVRGAARGGGINLHFSLLPRWRGAAPVQRALLAGDPATGVAVQRLDRRLDAGALLALVPEPIRPDDDTPKLLARLTEIGAPVLADVAARLAAGEEMAETPQDEEQVTLAPRIEKSEGRLDFTAESAEELVRRLRAFGDWPGCRFLLPGAGGGATEVRVRAAVAEPSAGAPAGQIVSANGAGIVVATRDGRFRITELQKPGSRALPAAAFLNGWAVPVGGRAG